MAPVSVRKRLVAPNDKRSQEYVDEESIVENESCFIVFAAEEITLC